MRTTDDIDALVVVPGVQMPALFETLSRGFALDVATFRELRDHGLTTFRFDGVLIDLMRPVIPVYTRVLDRSVERTIRGLQVRISSVEGLVLTKLIAMRPQDEADIRELLAAYSGRLDVAFIRSELVTFASPDDQRAAKFEGWLGDSVSRRD